MQVDPSISAPADTLVTSCHCGRVKIELPSKPENILECHCTVCYKYGAMWAFYKRNNVKVDATLLQKYVREDEGATGKVAFHRCSHCGNLMLWWGEKDYSAPDFKMGVNCRMLAERDIEGIEKKIVNKN